VELVLVAPTDALAGQIALRDEVRNYALGRAFRDANALGYIAEPDFGILRDAQKHMRVVGEERPARHTRTITHKFGFMKKEIRLARRDTHVVY
jgi:hypothetical protein